MMPAQQMVQTIQKPINAAATSASGVFVTFFANTLPVVQWIAALLAAVVAGMAIFNAVKKYLNK